MSDDEFLVQALGLPVVDQDEIRVVIESLDRLLELGLPLDRAVGFQAVFRRLTVKDAFRISRLHEAAKDLPPCLRLKSCTS